MKEVSIISKVVSRGKAEALPSASMPNWAELAKYVTIDGDETINGVKDFANGLMIGGLPLTKMQDDVVYLDAHLVVRGGITMFGTGEDVDVPTIMDALSVDGVNLQVINGVLTFVGEATGGVADSVRWENVIGRPTLLSSFTDDVVAGKYLPLSGGTLSNSGSSLTINRTATNATPYITFQSNGTDVGYIGVTPDKQYVGWDFNISQWRTFLNTGNYSSYALPLSGGTISGTEQIPLRITTNYNPTGSTFPVGLILTNTNKTNANGQNHGTAQFGYFKSAGAYIFNYNDYEKVNCAIGITDDGIAYVGKGGSIDTKYKIWHEGNHGSGSGLSADMLDGYHWSGFYRSYIEGINATNVDTFVNTKHTGTYSINHVGSYSGLLLSFNRGAGSVSSIELIAPHYDFHIYGLQARIAIDNNRYSALRTFAFTDSNVASATKLQTARTIWGQSFDGTGNVDGALKINKSTASGGDAAACILINGTFAETSYHRPLSFINSNMVIGAEPIIYIGFSNTQYNGGYFGFKYVGKNSSSNYVALGLYASDNLLCVLGNGNVGIGTTNPLAKFTVADGGIDVYNTQSDYSGAIGFNRKSNVGGVYNTSYHGHQIHNYKGDLQFYIEKTDSTWLHSLVIQGSSGNVGIGTDSPSQKLHVNGNIYANGYENVLYSLYEQTLKYSSNSGGFRIGRFDEPLGGLKLQFGGDGSGNFSIINRDWSVAVLTLTNSGNLSVSGGITMYSDQRKKTILNYVELSLKQIADAPLIEHYYNSDESKTTHVGSIAQYWAEMNDWFCKKDNEGFYTMEIQNAALASAISIARELVKYESKTDKKIRLLKKRIGELEDEIEKLKTA